MKVTAIHENQGWEKKTVGELMDSFHTYELQVLTEDNPNSLKNAKSIAFIADLENEVDNEDLDDESLALLMKNLNKILKGFNRHGQNQTRRNQSRPSN